MPHYRIGDKNFGHPVASYLDGISHRALATRPTPSLAAVSVPALAAAGALAAVLPAPAEAQCVTIGATVTCTGTTTTARTVNAGENLVLPDGNNSIQVDAGTGLSVVYLINPGSSITVGDGASIEQTGTTPSNGRTIRTAGGANTITCARRRPDFQCLLEHWRSRDTCECPYHPPRRGRWRRDRRGGACV